MAGADTRPFVDTNELFAALYSAESPPAAILEAHIRGRITMLISRQVLTELVNALREKRPDLLAPSMLS